MESASSIIYYYSRTKNTASVAQDLSDLLNCPMEEIIDWKKRKGIFSFLINGYEAITGKETKIAPISNNPKNFNHIILGFPVWASHIPPAIRTFINQYKNEINSISLFCTQGGNGGEKTFALIEEILNINPNFKIIINKKDVKTLNYMDNLESFLINEKFSLG